MAANHGIHTPDDDAYYHCPNNECSCHDGSTVYDSIDAVLDALTDDDASDAAPDYSADVDGTCCDPICYCDGWGCSCHNCGCAKCWD